LAALLDTSVAICLRDGDPRIIDRFEQLDVRPFLSVISRVELEGGVYAKSAFTQQRRRALDVLLEILPVLDFDLEMGAVYGQIVAGQGFSRRKIIDRMIAATALVHDLTVITLNSADFIDVPGLRIDDWGSSPAGSA
jgi:tRNA(fMet)-specific endonuclease VapC